MEEGELPDVSQLKQGGIEYKSEYKSESETLSKKRKTEDISQTCHISPYPNPELSQSPPIALSQTSSQALSRSSSLASQTEDITIESLIEAREYVTKTLSHNTVALIYNFCHGGIFAELVDGSPKYINDEALVDIIRLIVAPQGACTFNSNESRTVNLEKLTSLFSQDTPLTEKDILENFKEMSRDNKKSEYCNRNYKRQPSEMFIGERLICENIEISNSIVLTRTGDEVVSKLWAVNNPQNVENIRGMIFGANVSFLLPLEFTSFLFKIESEILSLITQYNSQNTQEPFTGGTVERINYKGTERYLISYEMGVDLFLCRYFIHYNAFKRVVEPNNELLIIPSILDKLGNKPGLTTLINTTSYMLYEYFQNCSLLALYDESCEIIVIENEEHHKQLKESMDENIFKHLHVVFPDTRGGRKTKKKIKRKSRRKTKRRKSRKKKYLK
jgi:hypothetical protein